MAKPAEICEEFRLSVYEKYKDQGWKYLKSAQAMKKVVKDVVFQVSFQPSFANQENVSARIEMRSIIWCKSLHKQCRQPGILGHFPYEAPFGQSYWWELIDPERRAASVLEAQKQIDATVIPLMELFSRDYTAGAQYLAEHGFVNPVIFDKNAHSDCKVMFIDKVLGREAAEQMLQKRYALMSFKKQQIFESGLQNCKKIMDEVKRYLEKDTYRVDYETYYIVENKLKYKNEPEKAEPSVMIEIPRNSEEAAELSAQEIAGWKELSYGVEDNNGALEQDEVGQKTVLYDPECIGRGIEIAISEEQISLHLSLPAGRSEIELLYELAKCMREKVGAALLRHNAACISLERLQECRNETENASMDALRIMEDSIRSGENENSTLKCALNPITLGSREMDEVGGSLDGLERFLHGLQQKDVFYADPEYMQRKDGTIFGIYFVGEQIVSVVPKTPYAPFSNMDSVDSWYVLIPDQNAIPYEDFISHVEKMEDYDDTHIIISLCEEKIYELSEKFAVNMFTKEPVKGTYGGTVFDDGRNHLRKIQGKKLPVEEAAAYNHLAVFLRWMCEHGLLSEKLKKELPGLPWQISDHDIDLREVIAKEPTFAGELKGCHFNKKGKAFAKGFYQFGKAGYPLCVDQYAESVLGTEKYHSEECKNEAYLFAPYGEEYYQGLSNYIEKAWEEFCK